MTGEKTEKTWNNGTRGPRCGNQFKIIKLATDNGDFVVLSCITLSYKLLQAYSSVSADYLNYAKKGRSRAETGKRLSLFDEWRRGPPDEELKLY